MASYLFIYAHVYFLPDIYYTYTNFDYFIR